MTTEEIAFVDDILAGKRIWDDFFRPHERGLHDYLEKINEQKNAHDELIGAVEVLFEKWYMIETVGSSNKQAEYIKNDKFESIKSNNVFETLNRLLIPAVILCIDDIQFSEFKDDFSDILYGIVSQGCKGYSASISSVVNVIYNLKENDAYFYVKLASDETYLLDRATEQSLLQSICINDTNAILQLKNFTWLGSARRQSLKTKFNDKLREGIRGVLHQSVVDQNKLIDNSNFITEIENYTLNYVVKQLQESGYLSASLITFILSFTYKVKYSKFIKKKIPTGAVPLYLQRRDIQILYDYNYNLKEGRNTYESLDNNQILSETIPDNELRIDEYYTTGREAVSKSFISLSLDCRQKLLYVNDAWLFLSYLTKDDDFMSFVSDTFDEKDEEGWPRNDKDKIKLRSIKKKFDVAKFKRQCLKCYKNFMVTLISATGNKSLTEFTKKGFQR